MSSDHVLAPPATVGIVGGGQLGRMSALAAQAMGYRVVVLEPKKSCACGSVADEHIVAGYDDEEGLRSLFEKADVVTFEFENVRREPLEKFAATIPVRPSPNILSIAQNREREKAFLSLNGFPLADYRVIDSDGDAAQVADSGFSFPAILKTADFGYDGKGQCTVRSPADLIAAWKTFGGARAVVEERIEFSAEYSVIVVRNPAGEVSSYPLCRNIHRDHILDVTLSPTSLSESLADKAATLGKEIAEKLGLEGVLAVELFLTKEEEWLVNEMAPRPHNSGHYSQNGSETSQFENHIRAVCNLPLGGTGALGHAAMQNLLGDTLVKVGDGLAKIAMESESSHLHLYDKGESLPGRKMGHINLRAENPQDLLDQLKLLRNRLALPAISESIE